MLVHSLPSFIFLINVIISVRQCHASSLFCLICLCCIFYHVTYFSICLLFVLLQVKYMLLKRRDSIVLFYCHSAKTLSVFTEQMFILMPFIKTNICKQCKYLPIRDPQFQKIGYYLYLYPQDGHIHMKWNTIQLLKVCINCK